MLADDVDEQPAKKAEDGTAGGERGRQIRKRCACREGAGEVLIVGVASRKHAQHHAVKHKVEQAVAHDPLPSQAGQVRVRLVAR